MPESTQPEMGDAAVAAKTGKTWPEWVAVLDDAGCRDMTHQRIVALLSDRHGLPAWWRQMVTNGYEKLIGRRRKGETGAGFQIGASKTIAAPVERLYAAFTDGAERSRW